MGDRKTEARQCAKVERHLFIDLDDKEFKGKTMKNLELSVEAAMPCKLKTFRYRETCGESNDRKSKHACIVEAHESTRKRLEWTLSKDLEDHIAVKGFHSLSLFLCTSSFPCSKR